MASIKIEDLNEPEKVIDLTKEEQQQVAAPKPPPPKSPPVKKSFLGLFK